MTSDLVAWTLQVLDTVVEKDCREVAGLVLDNMLVEVASAIDHNLAIHGKVFPVVVGLVFVANGTPDAGLGDGMLAAALEDSCAHDLLDVCSGASSTPKQVEHPRRRGAGAIRSRQRLLN